MLVKISTIIDFDTVASMLERKNELFYNKVYISKKYLFEIYKAGNEIRVFASIITVDFLTFEHAKSLLPVTYIP